MQIQLLCNVGHVADNLQAVDGTSETAAIAEDRHSLRLAGVKGHIANQGHQTSIDTGSVHVAAHGGHLDGWLNPLVKALLGQVEESLFDKFVAERLLVVQITDLRRHLRKRRMVGIGPVVVVEHTRVGLGDQFAGRRVEDNVVEAIERGLVIGNCPIGAILGLQRLLTSVVRLVAGIDRLGVALDREVAIDDRVLARQIRLVEIIGMRNVGAAETRLKHNRRIGADKEGDAASATRGTRVALGIQRNVTAHDNSITAIPGRRLNPVDGVENGVGPAIARVDCVDAFDVGVARGLEQLHQHGLDRLGLVQNGLGADFEAANGLGVDVVLAQEGGEGGQGDGIDV